MTVKWTFTPRYPGSSTVVSFARREGESCCGTLWLQSLPCSAFLEPEKLRLVKVLEMRDYYCVMLVRKHQNIYECLGVGEINPKIWDEAKPSRELIDLA
jgi:hypothetical protein